MGGVSSGKELAGQQQHLARLPGGGFLTGHRIQIYPPGARYVVGQLRPVRKARRIEIDRPRAVQYEVGMARCGAVGNHGHRQVGRVAGVVAHLHVENGREPAQPLCADAQPVHLVVEFQPQLLGAVRRSTGDQLLDVDGVHQRLLGQQHRLLRCSADAYAQQSWRTPARAHRRHCLQNPLDDRIGRVQHDELGLSFGPSALRRHRYIHRCAFDQLDIHNSRGVVFGVGPFSRRIGQDRGTQLVVRVEIGSTHAFIDHLLKVFTLLAGSSLEAHIHAHLHEGVHNARVLADGPVALGAHAAVDENLRDGVLGGG